VQGNVSGDLLLKEGMIAILYNQQARPR